MAQHGHRIGARDRFVFGNERAAQGRRHTQHVEITRRGQLDLHPLGSATVIQRHGVAPPAQHPFKQSRCLLEVLEAGIGEHGRTPPLGTNAPPLGFNEDQSARVPDGQRPQEDLLEDREDPGVGSDSEG